MEEPGYDDDDLEELIQRELDALHESDLEDEDDELDDGERNSLNRHDDSAEVDCINEYLTLI